MVKICIYDDVCSPFMSLIIKNNEIVDLDQAFVVIVPISSVHKNNFELEKIKDKKLIFLPNENLIESVNTFRCLYNNFYIKNSVYIQPNIMVEKLWSENFKHMNLPIKTHIFGIDMDSLSKNIPDKIISITSCFIYVQNPYINIDKIYEFLINKNIIPRIIYSDTISSYIDISKEMPKFGIWITTNEFYDFLLYEILGINIPLIILIIQDLTIKSICDLEYYTREIYTRNIPYWSYICGEIIHMSDLTKIEKFIEVYDRFLIGIQKDVYHPREYILENLDMKKSVSSLERILSSF